MSTPPEKYQRPQLRYRRFGGGYRREDVEYALAELRLTLSRLDQDLETLRDRNRDLETEVQQARQEVESFRAREHELSQTMAAALRRAAEIEDGANARAREILAEADEAALRIRADASRRIEDTSAQINELLRLKDNLLRAMRSVVGDFDQAVTRVERGEQLFPAAVPAVAAPPPPPPAPVPEQPAAVQEQPPAPPVVAPPPEPQPPAAEPPPSPAEPPVGPAVAEAEAEAEAEEQVFETRVELDAGPFTDFAGLSAFERALTHLSSVSDVYVRRLANDRALIELTLVEPGPLLQAMRSSLPYSIDVRSANRSRLVVDVTIQQTAGAR